MSIYDVEGGWRYVHPLEERAFQIDISGYPNALASIVSTSLYNISDIDSIGAATGTPLTGVSSHSSGTITTQKVDGSELSLNSQYELRVVWADTAGNSWLVTVPIMCKG